MANSIEFRPRCPTCDMLAEPGISDRYLPFCSERCRLIDLGRWLNEEHQLPVEAELPDGANPEDSTDAPRGSPPKLPPGWHDA